MNKTELRYLKWYLEIKNQEYKDSGLLFQAAINRGF